MFSSVETILGSNRANFSQKTYKICHETATNSCISHVRPSLETLSGPWSIAMISATGVMSSWTPSHYYEWNRPTYTHRLSYTIDVFRQASIFCLNTSAKVYNWPVMRLPVVSLRRVTVKLISWSGTSSKTLWLIKVMRQFSIWTVNKEIFWSDSNDCDLFPGQYIGAIFSYSMQTPTETIVTYRHHLPLDIFGGWHLRISPIVHLPDRKKKTLDSSL